MREESLRASLILYIDDGDMLWYNDCKYDTYSFLILEKNLHDIEH